MAEKPYRVETALSARSVCTVSKTKIDKGELRFGSLVNFGGKGTYKWRKLACITAKQVSNVEKEVGGLAGLDGFADLSIEQRAAVAAAFEAAASATKTQGEELQLQKKASKGSGKAKAQGDGPQPKKKAKVDGDSAAHKAIDLAKAADWPGLFAVLDVQPALVNARPEVREYAVLHQAAFHGHLATVNTLLDSYSADPALRTRSGQSVLDVAEERGHEHVVECLALRLAAKAKAKTQGLQSASASAEGGQPAPAEVQAQGLLSQGQQSSPAKAKGAPTGLLLTPEKPPKCGSKLAEPSALVHTAHRAIDLAKEAQWEDLLTLLDLRREVVNLRPDVREYGVLHQAAFHGSLDIVKVLVTKYGANPGLRSRHGETAEDIALKQGHAGVAAVLRSCPPVVAKAPEPEVPEEEDDAEVDLVQMPDGSWKVATATLQASSPSASSSSAPPPCSGGASVSSTTASVSNTSASSQPSEAVSAFKAAFLEKTANRWEDRGCFKPFFGKFTYSKPVAAPFKVPTVATPASDPAQIVMAAAHAVIDAAKAGKWAELYRLLDDKPELVNVRPDVREFAALHQAAYLGSREAVSTLIEKYGADPALKTKLGVSAVVVASGRGHAAVADFIAARLPA